MKHRYFLLAGINLCCLLVLLAGKQEFIRARTVRQEGSPILIAAVHFDGYSYLDADEAIALQNNSDFPVDIGGWSLSDGKTSAEIPQGTTIPARVQIWLTGDRDAFQEQFGFAPTAELATWPGYANSGDEVLLLDRQGQPVDVVVYGEGDNEITGWSGTAVQPYAVRGVFGREGQILFRKRDESTGQPVVDSNRQDDWAQDERDASNGRRVRYPGWDMETFFLPTRSIRAGALTIAITPDNGFETLEAAIEQATSSIEITSLTIESLAIGDALVRAAQRGVRIRLLLEGNPVGGVSNQEKAICEALETAGAQCWFMVSDAGARIYDRYRFVHAKYLIIDGRRAVISSENLSANSLPDDEKADGTWGRRGVLLITDDPVIVAGLENVFASDLDAHRHSDILRWAADHPDYGTPPPGFVPVQSSGGISYSVRYPRALTVYDAQALVLQQAPENLLRNSDGILGLVHQAGQGDVILAQQLQERPYWGPSTSNPADDPNLRLEAFIAAARRGATVRLMLDEFLDDDVSPVGNRATCTLLDDLARREHLRLQCTQANPTGLGIHNKMILAHVDGRGYVHVGSWNGTELASKGNREVALLVQSEMAYAYLADMFERDWPHDMYFPLIGGNYSGFVHHALISEVLYDPYGTDETEFIEIVNPTLKPIDLSNFSLGDAVSREDFEDVRRFPPGTLLGSGNVLVVATSADDFFAIYRIWPDFEILETSPDVPNLIDDPSWGDTDALLRLGNGGDEVILRDASDTVVDVLTYGAGSYPDHVPCPLLEGGNQSLERYPFWIDTDNCPADFREWPFPNPGRKP